MTASASLTPRAVMPFAQLLRQLRVEAGLTQAALAELASVSARGVQRLEADLGQPYPDTARRLADALGLLGEARANFVLAARPAPRERVGPQPATLNASLRRHNLPGSLTSFIGREHEIVDVQSRLESVRLLTLLGEGGSGKTRLALEVARGMLPRYPGGVCLVELAALADATLVPHQLASVLGIRDNMRQPILNAIVDFLRDQSSLVVLDNCEHLVYACAELADAVLSACAGVRIVATSREMLGATGESVWRVPPLSVPSTHRALSLPELLRSESVRLFVERATAVSPAFVVAQQNASAVADICRKLDGIPLAIELAAARVPVLCVEDIATRLDDCLPLLTTGNRTALPRHQTLRATLDWSYALLSEPERRLADRLSVFAGGWTLEAAEAVCAADGIDPQQVLDLTGLLVAKSMIVVDAAFGEMRYRMLETIRQYTAEKLRASSEESVVRGRHMQWLLDRARQFEESIDGPDQVMWLERMDLDLDNVRAALQWGKLEVGERDSALQIASHLKAFWWRRGHSQEACQHLGDMLNLDDDDRRLSIAARASALFAIGWLCNRQGDPGATRAAVQAALALARELGDKRQIGQSLSLLGHAAYQQNDLAAARSLLEEARAVAREIGGWPKSYITLMQLGNLAEREGAQDQARTLFEESLDLSREAGDVHGSAVIQHSIGRLDLGQGNLVNTRACLKECLLTFLSSALSEVPQVMATFAGLAIAESQPLRALRLAGGTHALRRAQGAGLQPIEQAQMERQLAPARRLLDEVAAARAWAEGEAMTLDELVACALEVPQPKPLLTRREQEVAGLLGRGQSNREIAAAMVISEGTAEVHVKHILAKLGFSSRGQITAWAVREGMDRPRPTTPARANANT